MNNLLPQTKIHYSGYVKFTPKNGFDQIETETVQILSNESIFGQINFD